MDSMTAAHASRLDQEPGIGLFILLKLPRESPPCLKGRNIALHFSCMHIRYLILWLLLPLIAVAQGQTGNTRSFIAQLHRADSLPILFNLDMEEPAGKQTWIIRNGAERIPVTDIRYSGDSVMVSMPVFESAFRLRKTAAGRFDGKWIKGTTTKDAIMPVTISPGTVKFPASRGKASGDISGRWRVTFVRPNGTTRPAVAEFSQQGTKLTGTFLTPSGDYRFLDGTMSADSLQLSCFDGSHAYYFGAKLRSDGSLADGVYASGATWMEKWHAVRDPNAVIDESISAMQLRPGEEEIGFRFPDADSNMVSLKDERFRGKVVVIQVMGSWCPNCMDETAFLSDYYRRNKDRGVEMIALAYEYSTDFNRASRSLKKFRDKYAVGYPMLITGVTSSDSLKTEKTLPQLTPIKAFPTTIFIGKDGKVKKIHAGFYGPGSGVHYDLYRKEFEETITGLLAQ
jgi:peroxiredoxin